MVCTSLSRRWNSEIAGYARRGRGRDAVQLYMHILRAFAASFKPNHFILASVVRACASLGAAQGRQIHAHVIKNQFQADPYIASALLHVYGSNGSVEDACQVFDRIPNPNVVCYTAIMVVSVRCGIPAQAWCTFKQMQVRGVAPNSRSFSAVLGCCEFLEQSQQIHGMAAKLGLQCSSVSVGNSLVNAYAKLGRMNDAYRVFDSMAEHDVVSWNCMISGCCQSGNHDSDVLHWYRLMLSRGFTPDDTSLASVISSCSKPDSITYGKQVHAQSILLGRANTLAVENALIAMYSKADMIEYAEILFEGMAEKDLVSWNSMLGAYVESNRFEEVLKHIHEMHRAGVGMDHITYSYMLGACRSTEAIQVGRQLHGQVILAGYGSHRIVMNSLVTMYIDCGNTEHAKRLFSMMPDKKIIDCWNSMMAAYARNGFVEDSLTLFHQMHQLDMEMDDFTFCSGISSCTGLLALGVGKQIHALIIKSAFALDIFVLTALVDLYAKCGLIKEACLIFNKISEWTDFACNTMINGYAVHGDAKKALELFESMKAQGIKPSRNTFISLLSACSHAGLVNGCLSLLHSMERKHGLAPMLQHYVCMVDALGRAGQLGEAVALINSISVKHVFDVRC